MVRYTDSVHTHEVYLTWWGCKEVVQVQAGAQGADVQQRGVEEAVDKEGEEGHVGGGWQDEVAVAVDHVDGGDEDQQMLYDLLSVKQVRSQLVAFRDEPAKKLKVSRNKSWPRKSGKASAA